MNWKIPLDNWVLIPCHNNADLLLKSLPTILSQSIGDIRIMAINNASGDNTPYALSQLSCEHIVISAYPQLGVSGAWNYGLSYLFGMAKAERVLVVNQDIELLPETYETLNTEPGQFVTAVSVGDLRALSEYVPPESRNRRPHPDFSCYRITRECFQKTGRFDEGFYPAWFEDNDYHIRMSQAGITAYCIDLPFYHYAAGTMKRASDYDAAHYYGPAFLNSKQRFFEKWGVLPGTKEYEDMCQTSIG